jgi:hypothetical protein
MVEVAPGARRLGGIPAHINELSSTRIRRVPTRLCLSTGSGICRVRAVYPASSIRRYSYGYVIGVFVAIGMVAIFVVIAAGPEEHGTSLPPSAHAESQQGALS